MRRTTCALVGALAACAVPDSADLPAGGGSSGGVESAGSSEAEGSSGGDDPNAAPCFDRHEAPELEYLARDDERLTDPEYGWARTRLLDTECAGCHRGEGSLNPDAPPYWEVLCEPVFTDSATDETLEALILAVGANNLRGAATDEEVERVQAVLHDELDRRAARRGE